MQKKDFINLHKETKKEHKKNKKREKSLYALRGEF